MDAMWFSTRGLTWADIEWAYLYNALVDSANENANLYRENDSLVRAHEMNTERIRSLEARIVDGTHENERLAERLSANRAEIRTLTTDRNIARRLADHFHTVFCNEPHNVAWEITTFGDTYYTDGSRNHEK